MDWNRLRRPLKKKKKSSQGGKGGEHEFKPLNSLTKKRSPSLVIKGVFLKKGETCFSPLKGEKFFGVSGPSLPSFF